MILVRVIQVDLYRLVALSSVFNRITTFQLVISLMEWFLLSITGERKGWPLLFGGNYQLGHWLCGSQLARCLYSDIEVYTMDHEYC